MTADMSKGRVVVSARTEDGQPLVPSTIFNAQATVFGAEQLQAGVTCAGLSQSLAAQVTDKLPKNMIFPAEGVVKTVCTDENGAPAGAMTCAITKPSRLQDDVRALRGCPSGTSVKCD